MPQNNRILLVDDEPRNLKILRIRLEKDFELKEAQSGEEALQVIEEFAPALVLLDIMMEGIDGYEVTRRIREVQSLRGTKIVLVSGKAMIDEKLMGYHAGADDYITKPFNGEELKAKVTVFTNLYNLENQLRKINQDLEAEVTRRCDQLLGAERLASIGLLSAEIVHNLKNPLTIIMFNANLLEREIGNNPRLTKITSASNKILEIIKSVLITSPSDIQDEYENVSVTAVIKEELDFLNLQSEFKHSIQKKINFNSEFSIYGARIQLAQILGNLIKNAAEAMIESSDKTVTITTETIGNDNFIRIADTGEGISKENLDKIFESQFSTKDGKNGKPLGNGLGLPYVKKTIEALGGQITVQSKLGQGTEFTLRFPVSLQAS